MQTLALRCVVAALAAAIGLSNIDGTIAGTAGQGRNRLEKISPKPQVVFSTDVSTGLIDTHGGMSLSPVDFSASHAYTTDSAVTPQDIDDGLALAMALNLEAKGYLKVLGIVPTYGNASLPAETIVVRQIVRSLKRRPNLPVVPGASGPVNQVIHPK